MWGNRGVRGEFKNFGNIKRVGAYAWTKWVEVSTVALSHVWMGFGVGKSKATVFKIFFFLM